MRAMGKRTVGAVLYTVSSRVCFVDTGAGFVVAKMVSSFSVTSISVEIGTSVCVCEGSINSKFLHDLILIII